MAMSLNHHILTKIATDEVLVKFKRTEWTCAGGDGKDFYRVGTSADFPSPDAMFYDPENKATIAFEFKPPTETKRGILTGIGQSIAYLQNSDISFLIAPKMLEDYPIGEYLISLYENHICGKLPAGLILYDNDNPSQVFLEKNVEALAIARVKHKPPKIERFWAKHQDLPIPLFHLILHYYYLKSTHGIEEDPFAVCWLKQMISPTVLDDLQTRPIIDVSGQVIMTLAGNKQMRFLEKIIPKLKGSLEEKQTALKQKIDHKYSGDNYYNSIKKNFVSFLKNMQVIDSQNCLTDSGYRLYHLGLVNGPTSKLFTDYFIKELLITGHHLDLILDFDALKQEEAGVGVNKILATMETEYEEKGYLKRNPKRQQADVSNVEFLKYERILWRALGLIDVNYTIQWKKITEICSLPDM